MFEIGNFVLYGSQGVCRVSDIRSEDFSGERKDYYILTPFDDAKMVIYVPTDAATLTGQMRPLLSPDELNALILEGKDEAALDWINDPRKRNEYFKTILSSGDRRLVVRLLRTLHEQRIKQEAIGKKLYAADEQAFSRAQKLLHGEIAISMNINPAEVQDYIRSLLAMES